jgi:hypothetical protein
MQYTSQRACSVSAKRSKLYPPLRRRRLETQQNITMSPSRGRSQFLGEFSAVLQRLEIWGLMQPAHQLKPFSRHRPSELCSSHGALYASYYFILYLRIYKYIECSGLWAGSHQKPRRRRSVCTGRACTKIERRVVCMPYIFYFALSTPNWIKWRLLAHVPSSRFQQLTLVVNSCCSAEA